jgi:methyltransferase family protein
VRGVLWPLRRFFDPRFHGVAAQMTVQHADVQRRLDAVGEDTDQSRKAAIEMRDLSQTVFHELKWLVETERLAAADATTMMGESLAELHSISERGFDDLAKRLTDMTDKALEQLAGSSYRSLDQRVAQLLNYAQGHCGFAAQRNLWFNPPVMIEHVAGDVHLSRVSERVVEVPYAFQALAELKAGASILDVGAAESTFALSLASLGYEVTALDPRPVPTPHPRLRRVVGTVQDWDPGTEFDAVVCISTLEHIGLGAYGEPIEPEGADHAALARMHDLLAAEGVLILTVPFGVAAESATARIYDRHALDLLLQKWHVENIRVVKRHDDVTWVMDTEVAVQAGSEAVALITARPKH